MAVVPSWIEAHCVVPDGFRAGEPFRLYDFQLVYIANFYLVRAGAQWVPEAPVLAPAFVHRRGILVGPQKLGKNPLGAAHIAAEAEGPVLFAGWAGQDEGYVCADHGCSCDWEYAYDPGEPMGMSWPTPLIQITAFSEDQTANTWDVLRPMIEKGPLADLIPKTGESFIRLRGTDDQSRIEIVTSSEQSRLGARTTFVLQDQLEGWWETNGMRKVADAQYRNLAGIGGRASLLANAWDPSQHSVAQREFESSEGGVYRQAIWAPGFASLPCNSDDHEHFADLLERRMIFETVYPSDVRRENGGHLDVDSAEAEAAAIALYDAPQARRWFGNEIVEGSGKAIAVDVWIARRRKAAYTPPDGALITIGIDGSVRWDHFPLIATEVASGYQWPLGIWVPGGPGREVDAEQVEAVLESAFDTWSVWRVYADPPYIESWLAKWAGRWGKDRVLPWETTRTKAMAYALRAWKTAITTGEMSHCADGELCRRFSTHVGNAVKRETGYRDDEGPLWTVQKDRPNSVNKIDSVPAAALSWEARNDALTAGALNVVEYVSAYEDASSSSILT